MWKEKERNMTIKLFMYLFIFYAWSYFSGITVLLAWLLLKRRKCNTQNQSSVQVATGYDLVAGGSHDSIILPAVSAHIYICFSSGARRIKIVHRETHWLLFIFLRRMNIVIVRPFLKMESSSASLLLDLQNLQPDLHKIYVRLHVLWNTAMWNEMLYELLYLNEFPCGI